MVSERDLIYELVWVPSQEEIAKEKAWIEAESNGLGLEVIQELAQRAKAARELTYSPYSGYGVGAALLAISGNVQIGMNIEIASYSESGHAEEDATKAAVIAGEVKQSGRRFVRAIAISHASDTAPCGRCRQILAEFSDNCLVIVANTEGEINRITSLKILLPYAFTPTDLGKE